MPSRPPLTPPAAPSAEQKSPHAWALQKYGQDFTVRIDDEDPRKPPKMVTVRKLSPKGAFCRAGVLALRHWIEDDLITLAEFDAAEAEFMAQKIER